VGLLASQRVGAAYVPMDQPPIENRTASSRRLISGKESRVSAGNDDGVHGVQDTSQLEPRRSGMPKEAHTKAAEHHENAAKSHRTAAEHHGKGDHAKGHEESTKAQTHSKTAREHSDMAHSKSQAQK
jgi:hypothetical protein